MCFDLPSLYQGYYQTGISRILRMRADSIFMCLTITLLVVIYGIFEARQIKIEYLTLSTKKISSDIGKVRIVQISDVHLGLIIGEARIKQIINTINKAKTGHSRVNRRPC